MMNDHDLVGAYVLDALSDEERAAFEQHLAACADCRAEVEELRGVVSLLPLALDEIEPPSTVRGRISDAIREEAQTPRGPHLLSPVPSPPDRQRAMFRLWPYLGAVAAVLLLGVGVWRFSQQDTGGSPLDRQLVAALARGATVTRIAGTSAAPGAGAALVQPRTSHAYMIVYGLPVTPRGHVYELWLIKGAAPVPSAVFRYHTSGPQVVSVPRRAQGFDVAAVTIERGPNGSSSPTGPKVLLGKLG